MQTIILRARIWTPEDRDVCNKLVGYCLANGLSVSADSFIMPPVADKKPVTFRIGNSAAESGAFKRLLTHLEAQ